MGFSIRPSISFSVPKVSAFEQQASASEQAQAFLLSTSCRRGAGIQDMTIMSDIHASQPEISRLSLPGTKNTMIDR
jgi:hypothetical protein